MARVAAAREVAARAVAVKEAEARVVVGMVAVETAVAR